MIRIRDYPKTITIGETVWKIKFVRNLGGTQTTETLGLCDHFDHVIYIRLRQTPQERLRTVCHEIIHCFEDEYGFTMPHALVHRLEKPLAELVMANLF